MKQYILVNPDDWKKIKNKNLLSQLKDAANKNNVVVGRKQVRHEVENHQGGTLFVERDVSVI